MTEIAPAKEKGQMVPFVHQLFVSERKGQEAFTGDKVVEDSSQMGAEDDSSGAHFNRQLFTALRGF